jgi:hypothetical protein
MTTDKSEEVLATVRRHLAARKIRKVLAQMMRQLKGGKREGKH